MDSEISINENRKINKKQTKDNVKAALYYCFNKSIILNIEVNDMWRLTSSPDESHESLFNLKKREKEIKDTHMVMAAVNRLPLLERKIIIHRFFQYRYEFDYEIVNQMDISKRSYERHKALAINRLADLLGCVAYED
jgi:ArpU family phage transcriptional regulator